MTSRLPVRVAVIGCVQFSEVALETICQSNQVEVCLVITRSSSPINSDFRDLTEMASRYVADVLRLEGNDQAAMFERMASLNLDIIFCMGWSYLLKAPILNLPKYGVVGYHPAELPNNRGRHPLIWALALGLQETASTFFLMDEGADSGPILSQRSLPIDPDWYATELYLAMCSLAVEQLRNMLADWEKTFRAAVPQKELGNIWRKRGRADGEIDWRMSAESIRNLVRALARPYPGAHFVYDGRDVIVWQAELASCDAPNLEPGKVLELDADRYCVKCGRGAVWLTELSAPLQLKKGEYL
jgi:methionyl-tRNA formyltransferase